MDYVLQTLRDIENAGLYRTLIESRVKGAKAFRPDEFFNFASNDYLGISAKADWQDEFLDYVRNSKDLGFVMGSTSSRLLAGDNPAFEILEDFLSELYSSASGTKKSVLLFNGGYHANTGILPALLDKGDLVLCDRLSHASIMDSLKLMPCAWKRYKHSDYDNLRFLLAENAGKYERIFIVTESVFSMDGDLSRLHRLAELKREFGAYLYIDEAHGAGVFGDMGLGLAEAQNILADVDVLMCTLGKAFASHGAFAVCSEAFKELLVNRCRPFIFSTAMAPICAIWTRFVIGKALGMREERTHLERISGKFFGDLRGAFGSERVLGGSQICALVAGSNESVSKLSSALAREKIWAPAIRYPTVPKNTARIRFSLNADMTYESVSEISERIVKIASAVL